MSLLNQNTIIIWILIIFTAVNSHDRKIKVKLKSVKCDFDGPMFNGTMKCFVKSYRNGSQTATAIYNFRKPCNDMWVHMIVYYKFGGSALYRPWMFNFDENLCAIFKGREAGTFYKILLAVLDKITPGTAHACPYKGEEGIRDLNFDLVISRTIPHVIPTGDYRLLFRFHTSKNETFISALFGGYVAPSNPLEAVSMG